MVCTLAVYAQTAGFDFVLYDDPQYVRDNPSVSAGLSWAAVRWAFLETYAANWHPLTWLSHMLDCQVFGLAPGAHHAVSVAFHVATTVLLFGLLLRCTHDPWPSAFVAVAFALHPTHVESVAWIAERKDVLSACWWMATLWAYFRYARDGSRRWW